MNEEIKALSDEWDNHKKLPFPDAPAEGSPFNDLYEHLTKFDGHVAGMVSSALNGKPVEKIAVGNSLLMINNLFYKLNEIKPLDTSMDKYRSSINERIESLHRLIEDLLLATFTK